MSGYPTETVRSGETCFIRITDVDLCKPHKTIHLLVSTNPELNSTQLAWDKYYGFDYLTYIIYRSATGANFTVATEISSSLNSWTDSDTITGDPYYRIAVLKPGSCSPTGLGGTKAGAGDDDNSSFTLLSNLLLAIDVFDYETKSQYTVRIRSIDSKGNYIENIFIIIISDVNESTGVGNIVGMQAKVFPNPFSSSTTLQFPNPENRSYNLYIMDLSGKVQRIEEGISGTQYIIERGSLRNGYYLFELRGDVIHRGRLIVE